MIGWNDLTPFGQSVIGSIGVILLALLLWG